MLGLLTWKLLGEPVVLRPRELPPWTRTNLFTNSCMGGSSPSMQERCLLFREDSHLGVCDPDAYGFEHSEHPRAGDIACWRGDNGWLSTFSRYVSGCRFSHTGPIIADGTVGHITLGGWVEEPVPDDVVVFDAALTDSERSRFAHYWATADRPKGYGFHGAFLIAVLNVCCMSRRSNFFHLLDTTSFCTLLWLGALHWLAGLWFIFSAIRVSVNYGIQKPVGNRREATKGAAKEDRT